MSQTVSHRMSQVINSYMDSSPWRIHHLPQDEVSLRAAISAMEELGRWKEALALSWSHVQDSCADDGGRKDDSDGFEK